MVLNSLNQHFDWTLSTFSSVNLSLQVHYPPPLAKQTGPLLVPMTRTWRQIAQESTDRPGDVAGWQFGDRGWWAVSGWSEAWRATVDRSHADHNINTTPRYATVTFFVEHRFGGAFPPSTNGT